MFKEYLWVVRDASCGNGDDDSGEVLGVFSSEEYAEEFMKSNPPTTTSPDNYSIWIEGPFILNKGKI